MTVMWWPTVCRRKDRCCQPETPVCDLTVWCDFIGARHASITRECRRAEREGSTHVGRATSRRLLRSRGWPIVATASGSTSGEFSRRLLTVTTFVKDFHANRCTFTFLFTYTNEPTQMRGKDLVGTKVKLKELLMDIRSSMRKSSGEQTLGWMVRCLEEGLPVEDLFHPQFSDRNHLLACLELCGAGVHGSTLAVQGSVPALSCALA